jgi:hypothetical protein
MSQSPSNAEIPSERIPLVEYREWSSEFVGEPLERHIERIRELSEMIWKYTPKPHPFILSNKRFDHYMKKMDEGMNSQDALFSAITEA